MKYEILVVDPSEMPTDKGWLMIKHDEGLLCVLDRTRAGDPAVLAEAWAAARRHQAWMPPLREAG